MELSVIYGCNEVLICNATGLRREQGLYRSVSTYLGLCMCSQKQDFTNSTLPTTIISDLTFIYRCMVRVRLAIIHRENNFENLKIYIKFYSNCDGNKLSEKYTRLKLRESVSRVETHFKTTTAITFPKCSQRMWWF